MCVCMFMVSCLRVGKVCVCVLHPGVGTACAKNLFLIKVCSYMVYVYMHVYHWIKIDRDAFIRVIH